MKLFSIITICWNNLTEVKKTFQSVDLQNCKDFEWIVIDGNSKDGTKEWLEKNTLANWISEPDGGIYDAMNKGIDKASGEYLIFMNSGDEFANETVLAETKTSIEEKGRPHFVFGDSYDIDQNKTKHLRKAKHHTKNWVGMITQHQAMFFYKPELKGLKYSMKYALAGDYAFISQVLKNTPEDKLLYLEFPVCKFDMGGINELQRFKALKEDYRIRRDIMEVPYLKNQVLFGLHYIHTIIKKTSPSSRFIKHKSVN